jgi:hypothetical protein
MGAGRLEDIVNHRRTQGFGITTVVPIMKGKPTTASTVFSLGKTQYV